MNGAESLVQTFLQADVDVCFANPGTSEMHFVAALDRHPDMRCVLCLFEGGVTGAADGYFRMTGNVAATLLHLAPGFGNGFANLHNAQKAGSGIVNVVGDHATYHQRYESPLKSDAPGISRTVSHWTRVSPDAPSVAGDGAAAIRAARSKNGQIATLILPADTAWEEGSTPVAAPAPPPLVRPDPRVVDHAARQLCQPGAALMIGGRALYGDAMRLAGQIAQKSGCRLMGPLFAPRLQSGAGSVVLDRLAYGVDQNIELLAGTKTMVLCGVGRPVGFFAYPDKPSLPEPPDMTLIDLCSAEMDCLWTLQALAEALDVADDTPCPVQPLDLPAQPSGEMALEKVGAALAALMPEQAIVVDEAITSNAAMIPASVTARPHERLSLMGGAIGQCLPCATGAAVACPDRKVIALTGDGSAMYTLQSLWTMAREGLDVTVIVFANRGYQILWGELANVGAGQAGRNAARMFDITDPMLDWVSLAKGHGVDGAQATDMDSFVAALTHAMATKGPYLIEVVL